MIDVVSGLWRCPVMLCAVELLVRARLVCAVYLRCVSAVLCKRWRGGVCGAAQPQGHHNF